MFFDVRFTPESDRLLRRREMTLSANTDQRAAQQFQVGLDWLGSRGAFDPRVDLSAERPEVDWLAQERLGSACQRPPLRILVAISGDHYDREL